MLNLGPRTHLVLLSLGIIAGGLILLCGSKTSSWTTSDRDGASPDLMGNRSEWAAAELGHQQISRSTAAMQPAGAAHWIRVGVRDDLGAVVAGAEVRATLSSGGLVGIVDELPESLQGNGFTDGDGECMVHLQSAGLFDITVLDTRHPSTVIRGCRSNCRFQVSLARRGTVYGRAISREGPVSQAIVKARSQTSGVLPEAFTDANGCFFVEGLAPGAGSLAVRAAGYAPTAQTFQMSSGGVVHIEVELETGDSLRGLVCDAETGIGIPEAQVAHTWTFQNAVRTDSAGRFMISHLATIRNRPGMRHRDLHAQAPGYAQAVVRLHATSTGDVEFRLSRGSRVKGRLIGPCYSHVQLQAVGSHVTEQASNLRDIVTGRIASDNEFVIDGLGNDRAYALVIASRDVRFGSAIFSLPPTRSGETLDLGDVHLPEPREVAGRLTDSEGVPLSGRAVDLEGWSAGMSRLLIGEIRRSPRPTMPQRLWWRTTTDVAGAFRFPSVAAGQYGIACRDPAVPGFSRLDVEITDTSVEGLELVVPTAGSIRGSVMTLGRVQDKDLPSFVVGARGDDGSVRKARVGMDGRFCIAPVAQGDIFTVFAVRSPKSWILKRHPRVVAGGEDVLLEVNAATTVAGVVETEDGTRVRASLYGAIDETAGGVWLTDTNERGEFTIEVDPEQDVNLSARVTTRPWLRGDKVVPAGHANVVITVR